MPGPYEDRNDAVGASSGAPPVMPQTPADRRQVAQIAYDIWVRRGRNSGDDLWNWLSAENFIRENRRTVGEPFDLGGEA